MKRISAYMIAAAMVLAACNESDRLELERLTAEQDSLQKVIDGIDVPGAVDPDEVDESSLKIIFDAPRYGVDAGGSATLTFTLSEKAAVEVASKDGWSASVKMTGDTEGEITVTAPDPAETVALVATATAENGKMTAEELPLAVRDPYTDATRPQLKSMGYYSFKPGEASLENYQKLAEAGINMITVECHDSDYLTQMTLAGEAGLKVMAIVIDYAYAYSRDQSRTELDDVVNTIKNRPELYGYHIYDEPKMDEALTLKIAKDRVEELDPNHPVYLNLNPEASASGLGIESYYDYINNFQTLVNFEQISFDMYPIVNDPRYTYLDEGVMTNWHKCLDVVATVAKNHGVPFWAFAASCWIDKEANVPVRAKPTVENLRLQIYTDLAYGAQAVQYFTIRSYGGTDYAPYNVYYDSASDQWLRAWTTAYDDLKTANLDMQRRAFVFEGCTIARRGCTGTLRMSDTAFDKSFLPDEIADLSTSGDALVSMVENGGNRYIAIVNNSWKTKQTVSAVAGNVIWSIGRDGSFTEYKPGDEISLTLDEGDLIVFKYR